jgi:hypothetical protein
MAQLVKTKLDVTKPELSLPWMGGLALMLVVLFIVWNLSQSGASFLQGFASKAAPTSGWDAFQGMS